MAQLSYHFKSVGHSLSLTCPDLKEKMYKIPFLSFLIYTFVVLLLVICDISRDEMTSECGNSHNRFM